MKYLLQYKASKAIKKNRDKQIKIGNCHGKKSKQIMTEMLLGPLSKLVFEKIWILFASMFQMIGDVQILVKTDKLTNKESSCLMNW